MYGPPDECKGEVERDEEESLRKCIRLYFGDSSPSHDEFRACLSS